MKKIFIFATLVVEIALFSGCADSDMLVSPNTNNLGDGGVTITLLDGKGLHKGLPGSGTESSNLEIVASFTDGKREALADTYQVAYDVGQWFTIFDETGRVRYDLAVNGKPVPAWSIKDGKVHFILSFNPLEVQFQDATSGATNYVQVEIRYIGKTSDTEIKYRGSFNNWTWTQMSQINDSTWVAPYSEYILASPTMNEINIMGSEGPSDWRLRKIYVDGVLLRRAKIERDGEGHITSAKIFFTKDPDTGEISNPGNEDLYTGSVDFGEG